MAIERAMSFGAIADDYNRLRAAPPDAAVGWLLPSDCLLAVDLAAGTGLLARALARRAGRVVAVEPDGRMAAVLRARSSGVPVVQGKGEALPLRDASADGVFISSAWHWLDPDLAVPEIGRVLRAGGRFGVIWTSRDREVDWIREIDQLRYPAGAGGGAGAGGNETPRPWRHAVTLPQSEMFENFDTVSFSFTRTMTISDIAAMLATYSGLIVAGHADRAATLARACRT